MASLTRKYDDKKLLGKVYTPDFIVEKILNEVGVNNPACLGKKILDPACGDGRFLMAVAQRIIQYSPKEKVKDNLAFIEGWDVDSQAVQKCIEKLNNLIQPLGIEVKWNIHVKNAFRVITDYGMPKFDFIIGNPPYIRIQHLDKQERAFIQHYFKFCKSGSTDSYIAFYELCYYLLNENGICGLITPNTFLYSETAKYMRNYFAAHQNIFKIINYRHLQVFDNATTYSAIVVFGKKSLSHLIYQQAKHLDEFEERTIPYTEIVNQKVWSLSTQPVQQENGVKLKEICDIHVGITTLCDKAYIFSIEDIPNDSNYVIANTRLKGKIKIEKSILKPIIKASKVKQDSQEIKEFILFPYKKVNGKHRIISEEELKQNYPLAYAYLLSVKNELDKRDNGKPNPVAWYAFGRSQGLDTSFGKKILFSPMNIKPNFVYVQHEEATFYSGYCIKLKEGDNYHFLLEQLNSERLLNFIAISARDFRNGWKGYNKKIIEEFVVRWEKS